MSETEIMALKIALARIEEMLRSHFARDDERYQRWETLAERVNTLESAEDQRKGGKAMLAALMGAAALVGGLLAKLLPVGMVK